MKHLLAFPACLLVASSSAGAATYYVSPTGNNANPCTAESPCQTISHGKTKLVSGDTLYVHHGIYNEELKNPLPSNTELTGQADNRPVLRPTTSVNGGYAILLNVNRSNITFENLVIDASQMPTANSCLTSNRTTVITRLILQDYECIGKLNRAASTAAGITIGNNTSGAIVRRGKVHSWDSHESNPRAHGFYWRGDNGLIEENEIFNTNGYGLQFYNASCGVDGNIFRRNYVHHTGAVMCVWRCLGIQPTHPDEPRRVSWRSVDLSVPRARRDKPIRLGYTLAYHTRHTSLPICLCRL
jgi:hypothetical protein